MVYNDSQQSGGSTVAVSGTSTEILGSRVGFSKRRKSFTIVPTTAGVIVTVVKGDVPAVALSGIVMQQYQIMTESSSEGYVCFQGPIQAVASAAGAVAISEDFE